MKAWASNAWLFGTLFVVGFGVAEDTIGCAAALPVVDIADATCKQLDSQPEPAWVYFSCVVESAVGDVVRTFVMKVPASQAATFAAAHGGTTVTVTSNDAGP